jgi:hypothetical protein
LTSAFWPTSNFYLSEPQVKQVFPAERKEQHAPENSFCSRFPLHHHLRLQFAQTQTLYIMPCRYYSLLSLLILYCYSSSSSSSCRSSSVYASALKLSSSSRNKKYTHVQHQRYLKEQDNDKGGKNDKTGNEGPAQVPPTSLPTIPPTTPQPTQSPTIAATTAAPIQSQVPVTTISPTDSNNGDSISLTLDDLRDIQFHGGGQITLRFSLWFEDGTLANQANSGDTLIGVLDSLQSLLCEDTTSSSALDEDVQDTLGLEDEEERELCIVSNDLGSSQNRQPESSSMEGSILIQPPTVFVADRSDADANLQWTTWRVTFSVLRLGTFYILQGLENASDGATEDLEEEDIYRAGVLAMQQVLELALQVSIREQSYDKLLLTSMLEQNNDIGYVLASVYGEEIETVPPKLDWLGIEQPEPLDATTVVDPTETTTPEGESNANTEEDIPVFDIFLPDGNGDDEGTEDQTLTPTEDGEDAEEDEEDDSWDDDRYSEEFGITETLNPSFWHPLRIVGIIMFVSTVACLVGLATMSKRRQRRRRLEAKLLKEGSSGLLNNPQGVEDMLRASGRTTAASPAVVTPTASKSASKDEDTNDKKDDDDDDDARNIPMPSSLQMS